MTAVANQADASLTPCPIVDMGLLMKPISKGTPAGANVRYDPIYDEIAKARREDEDLPRGIWEINLKKAQWDQVELHCTTVLTTQSKDLQVAAWLAEAWMCLRGIAGLTQGLTLLTKMCEGFWPTLYPEIDNGDVEFRLSILEWVNEKLTDRLIIIPMTSPAEIGGQVYFWADVVSAGVLELQAKRHPSGDRLIAQAQDAGEATLERVGASATQTPKVFYDKVVADIASAQAAIVALEEVLHTCYPDHPHSFYKIRNVLSEMVRFIQAYQVVEVPVEASVEAPEEVPQEPEQETEKVSQEEASASVDEDVIVAPQAAALPPTPAQPVQQNGEITSRVQAYDLLTKVAEYLEKTEPHSPTPVVLKRVAQWGRMSLPELLTDVKAAQVDLLGVGK